MRRIVELSVVVLAIAALIISSSAQLPSFKSITSHGEIRRFPWLHVEGQWIVDEQGNRVALRGGGGSYTAYNRWDDLERFFQEVKGVGGNCYRLAFNPPHRVGDTWDVKMTEYDPAKMDRVLDLCEQYGIYAILDCHHWQGSDWQLLPNYKDYWIQTWVEIANRYKDRSIVAGYELCNEAWGYQEWALECIDAIRQVDPNHMIFLIESANRVWEIYWGTSWDYSRTRPNCVWTTHHWGGPSGVAYNATDFPMGYVVASLYVSALKELRNLHNIPVLAGEFGVYDYNVANADAEHVREIIGLCEDQGVGWWYWMMEKLVRDSGKSMSDLVPTPFESPIYGPDIPRPFTPKPFNLEDKIVAYGPRARDIGYCWWDYTYHAIAGPDAWIEISGPCTIRIREWDVSIWWGTLVADYLVPIPEGETRKIEFSLTKEVFAN